MARIANGRVSLITGPPATAQTVNRFEFGAGMVCAMTMYNAMRSSHTMSAPTKLVTADELARMPDDDYKYELVEGRLIRMSPTGFSHGLLAARLGTALTQFADDHGLGGVAVETGYTLARDPDTVRAPDVSFVSHDRIASARASRGYWDAPPDLAIEVLSPDDRRSEIGQKVREYLARGVRLVWVVDPDERTVTVHRPVLEPQILSTEESLEGHDVIPGFTYPLRRLFE